MFLSVEYSLCVLQVIIFSTTAMLLQVLCNDAACPGYYIFENLLRTSWLILSIAPVLYSPKGSELLASDAQKCSFQDYFTPKTS